MTTVNLVPNATLQSFGDLFQGSSGNTTAHAIVSDGNDTSSLGMNAGVHGNGDFLFELSSFTLPANSIIRSATVAGRAANLESYNLSLTARLWAATGSTVAEWTVPFPTPFLLGDFAATPATLRSPIRRSSTGCSSSLRTPPGMPAARSLSTSTKSRSRSSTSRHRR